MGRLKKLFQNLKEVSTGDISAYQRITREFAERDYAFRPRSYSEEQKDKAAEKESK